MTIRRVLHTTAEARAWADSGELFAILDACDTPSVVAKVHELGDERAVSLYRGMAEEVFESIAPYLVAVDAAMFDWIVDTLWSEPWGVFVQSTVELNALRTHFRKFLIVESPVGENWYFRYYDPRVLVAYLSTCTDAELGHFFGPVDGLALVDENSTAVARMAPPSFERV